MGYNVYDVYDEMGKLITETLEDSKVLDEDKDEESREYFDLDLFLEKVDTMDAGKLMTLSKFCYVLLNRIAENEEWSVLKEIKRMIEENYGSSYEFEALVVAHKADSLDMEGPIPKNWRVEMLSGTLEE